VLVRREGWLLNRMRARRRKPIALHRGPAPIPTGPTKRWSMDVVPETLGDGRTFRVVTVVDNWSRHSPMLEVGLRMPGAAVGQALDRVLTGVSGPRSITVDHGTEFQSRALEDWAYRWGGQLDFIRPGKPVENAVIEPWNGRLRDEFLHVHPFASLAEAQTTIETWRLDYNQRRPHRSLGHLTPNEVLEQRQALQTVKEVGCSSEVLSRNGANVRGAYGISLSPINVVINDRAAALESNNMLNVLVPIFDRKDLWILGHDYNSGFVYRSNTVFTTPGLEFYHSCLSHCTSCCFPAQRQASSLPLAPPQALTR